MALKHDGLEVPVWSTKEMNLAIKSTKAECRVLETAGTRRQLTARILRRYDKEGDGKMNEQEQAAFERARRNRKQKQR